jgi:pimeloyl-ACP methyl ester carboxylesterase
MPGFERLQISPCGEPPLAYVRLGRGRDVVLIHGALSALDDMVIALGPSLAGGFRVTAFDRPGHGASGKLGASGSPWRQARSLRAAIGQMDLNRPVVVGHSYGGAVAVAYALQFPDEIAGAVALAPLVFPEVRLEHLLFGLRAAPWVGPVVNGVASTVLDPWIVPFLWRAMFLPQAMPDAFAAEFPFETAGAMPQKEAEGEDAALLLPGLACSAMNYPGCRAPIRILAGDRDIVVNNRLHGGMLAHLAPEARYRELSGLGHMLHHFAQDAVLAAVTELSG